MAGWLRRIRGAIGMGLVWAGGWAVVGLAIGVASVLVPGLPWDRFFEVFDAPLPALGVPGFFGGVLFSVVLGVAGRRRRFDQLSLPRFAAWGALGGVLLALLPAALVAVGLATLGSPEVTVWQLTVPIIAPLALLSSASAAAALTLARRAERRELAAGEAAVAGLDEADADHRLG